VTSTEVVVGLVLAVFLLAMGLFVGLRQVAALRRLGRESLPWEEYHYERRKAWRRLSSSVLLLLMAGLLGGLQFYAAKANQLANDRAQVAEKDRTPPTPQQKGFLRVYIGAYIAFLILLLAVLTLAALDLWATRSYGLRQYRKLSEDRRAMIQRQVNRMRQEGNGET
jgi:hypothetical protein